jgi:predicted pyridoxine 5'-phosphate oxidase superfamily flavin-nucleotide-binding protein
MAKLSGEMKTMFERQLAVIATASSDGTPNVGPKGSMHVVDDQTLAYSEGTGQKTLRNLLQNPKVAVMVLDRDASDGYQCKGTAEVFTTGDFYEREAKRSESRGRSRPTHVVRIKIEEIYSVKPGLTGKKMA